MTTFECCPQCDEPKFPQGQETGGEKATGWPGCVNPQCIAYGEQQASVSFNDSDGVALLLQNKLNNLRQWILDQGYEFKFEEEK